MAVIKNWIGNATPPRRPRPQPSAFAQWVYLNSIPQRETKPKTGENQRDLMALGEFSHQKIEYFLQHKWMKERLCQSAPSDWKLFFVDNEERRRSPFVGSRLRVNGEALRCYPDLVLRNENENLFLIVERKTTYIREQYIPKTGWPNVEAQLWCYSWIDEFLDADDVLLIGQLWLRKGVTRPSLSLMHTHSMWKRSDKDHEARCRLWFEKYGGKIQLA